MTTGEALAAAARDVHAAARSHKRASDHHRKQARELMARYEALRVELERLGIKLTIQAEGEGSHGHEGRTARPIHDR